MLLHDTSVRGVDGTEVCVCVCVLVLGPVRALVCMHACVYVRVHLCVCACARAFPCVRLCAVWCVCVHVRTADSFYL